VSDAIDRDVLLSAAIANNVAWCATVCSAHAVGDRSDSTLWATDATPPRYYPDVITLGRDTPASAVAAIVAGRARASVKDSFARLDLAALDLRVLFDARWLAWIPADGVRPPDPKARWSPIRTAAVLARWEAAWATGPDDRGTFPPVLLERTDVHFLAGWRDGEITAAFVAFETGRFVGITNEHGGLDRAGFAAGLSAIGALRGDRPVIGYAADRAASALVNAGATELGRLRVWARP
jgi:hypothetical protein